MNKLIANVIVMGFMVSVVWGVCALFKIDPGVFVGVSTFIVTGAILTRSKIGSAGITTAAITVGLICALPIVIGGWVGAITFWITNIIFGYRIINKKWL